MKRKKEIKMSWSLIAQIGRKIMALTKIKTQKRRKKIRLGIRIMSSALNMAEVPTKHPCTLFNSNRNFGY